jgi:hypothetical protein
MLKSRPSSPVGSCSCSCLISVRPEEKNPYVSHVSLDIPPPHSALLKTRSNLGHASSILLPVGEPLGAACSCAGSAILPIASTKARQGSICKSRCQSTRKFRRQHKGKSSGGVVAVVGSIEALSQTTRFRRRSQPICQMRDDGGRSAEILLSQSSTNALISCPEKQLLRDTQWAQTGRPEI